MNVPSQKKPESAGLWRYIGFWKSEAGDTQPVVEVIEAPDWKANLELKGEAELPRNRLLHWGPIVALGITFYIGVVSTYFAVLWWPLDFLGGFLNTAIFFIWNYSTIVNLTRASFVGPGHVPLKWHPHEDEKISPNEPIDTLLQWCEPCSGYKVPRSHHCSHCGRCSMKMDHHCPWINNCVGHRNHAFFVRFLVSAVIGCLHALVILIAAFYHAIHFNYYYRYGDGSEPLIPLTFWSLIGMVIASAFAFGVVVGVGGLLYLQLKYIKNNKTGIEEYIEQKAISYRKEEECDWEDFTYPYDLGWKRNFREVLFSWSGETTGNGVWWPVRKGCDQFSLSREQLRQKALKRYLSRIVAVQKNFRGGIFGSVFIGCRLFICQPISEEPRLKISVNEEYVVTRGQRGWLYGYKVDNEKVKGWFPRVCVRFTDKYPFQMETDQSKNTATTSKS
uniref:Palmitoyltransferase n=1 Tax=Haemonchus contortus TaxID=6289 RepID=A0A7I4YKH6_HAECO